jgi:hypothetical protein
MFVFHCIRIRGWQSSDTWMTASRDISKTLTNTVVEGLGSWLYSGVNL